MKQKKCFRRMDFWKSAALALIVALVGGCVTPDTRKEEPFLDKWQVVAEKSKGYSPSGDMQNENALPTRPRTAPAEAAAGIDMALHPSLPQQTVSLEMIDVEIATLLRALARATNQNIIINEKIRGKASVNIQKASWDQVFLSILGTHGLSYAWEGEIIRIMTAEDMEAALKQETQKKSLKLARPLETRIVPVNYAEAANLKGNLEQFLTKTPEGNPLGAVMVDEHTNALILYALAEDIDEMISLIRQLDRPTPQVLIEAHIVEATSDTARALGVQWGGLHVTSQGDKNYWLAPNANSATGVQPGAGQTVSPASGYAANFPVDLTGGVGFTLGFIVEKAGESILQAQLSALQEEGKLHILSSPSITTLDNQEAVIESGREVPYQSVEDGDVKIEFKKAVLSLIVTPHVIDNRMLKLKIDTKKDELDFANSVAGQPLVITKKALTNVLLFDGETTVIGGLSKETRSDAESGVPGFKDVPLLGYLFKSSTKSNDMEDLLIFITPHILKERFREPPDEPAENRQTGKQTMEGTESP